MSVTVCLLWARSLPGPDTLLKSLSHLLCPKAEGTKQKSRPEGGSQSRTFFPSPCLARGPLKGLGASHCNLHLSLSQLPPGAGRQVNEPSLESTQGSKDRRENHLQRTASCSWGSLPELHQIALLPDKKQNHPFLGGSTAWQVHAVGLQFLWWL